MLDADIKTYHASEVSAASTNGGRRGTTQVISGVVNNVWPHVPKAERTAGATLYRKLFTLASDDDDGTLIDAAEYLDNPTDGDDHIVAFEATQIDTQADITGSERKYGSALVSTDIASAVSTFDVTVEHVDYATGTNAIFKVGDTVRLTDKVTPDAVAGNEELLTITVVSNVSTVVTVTVSETIANAYTVASGSRVSSLISYSDIECSVDSYVVTTAGDGTFDDTLYPIVCDNIGTVEDALTFTFTDATHFTCVGSSGINYGSGDTSTNFSPTNGDVSKPYFTLDYNAWVDTWANGDTLACDIHEASFAFWLKRTVPAGCASLANNKLTTVTTGESDI